MWWCHSSRNKVCDLFKGFINMNILGLQGRTKCIFFTGEQKYIASQSALDDEPVPPPPTHEL